MLTLKRMCRCCSARPRVVLQVLWRRSSSVIVLWIRLALSCLLVQLLSSSTSWLPRRRSEMPMILRVLRPTTSFWCRLTASSAGLALGLSAVVVSTWTVVRTFPRFLRISRRTSILSTSMRSSRTRSSRWSTVSLFTPSSSVTRCIRFLSMLSRWTLFGNSIAPYWLDTNVGEIYLAHEVPVGLSGYYVVEYVGKAGLNWDCYRVKQFISEYTNP